MSKFFTILKREYSQVVKKKSFIVGILLTPILMSAFMLIPALLASQEAEESEAVAIIDRSERGFGDQLSRELAGYTIGPDTMPAFDIKDVFVLSPEDTTRYKALYDSLTLAVSGKLLQFYMVIGPNAHLADTNSFIVTNSDAFRSLSRFESAMTKTLSTYRLTSSEINLPVDSVLSLTHRMDLVKKDTRGEAIPFEVKYFGALIFVMLMYAMIIGNGSMLMRSVIEEKSSRIIEVLVSSVTPFQLMFGKIMGLGLAAFTQVAIWIILGAGIFFLSGTATLQMNASIARIAFNPMIVTFFALYFITGYIMYSAIFALVGSIVNNDKEAQSFVVPITMSLIFPVIVGIGIVQNPYATWVQVIGYIPFFTPTLQLMRVIFLAPTAGTLSFTSGILMEATLGLLVVIVATTGIIWVTSRIFRIGILMYGKRPTLPELIKWVRHA
jgi:ABC-2 type transport system permease protein